MTADNTSNNITNNKNNNSNNSNNGSNNNDNNIEVLTSIKQWIVDSREPSSISKLLKKYKIPYIIKLLPVGDLAYGEIVIERKTVIDLANSVKTGRIWRQLKELELIDGKPILLVELRGRKYWEYLNYLGSISSYAAKHGIYVIVVSNRYGLANTLKMLMNGRKHRNISLKRKWKGYPIQYSILGQFPNIGIAKAKQLLIIYGNLNKIFGASEEELSKIVGKITARKFIEVLTENMHSIKNNSSK